MIFNRRHTLSLVNVNKTFSVCLGICLILLGVTPMISNAQTPPRTLNPCRDSVGLFRMKEDHVTRTLWSPDGRYLALARFSVDVLNCIRSPRIQVWDMSTQAASLVREFAIDYPTVALAWSQNNSYLAISHQPGMVHIWNIASGQLLQTLTASSHPLYDLAWINNDTQVMSGGADNVLRVHTVSTGQMERVHDFGAPQTIGVDNYIAWMQLSPTSAGSLMVIGKDGSMQILNTDTFSTRLTIPTQLGQPVYGDWNPTGTRLVSVVGHDNFASVWDVTAGQRLHNLIGHTGMVRMATWSPDGQYIATASSDNTIRLWQAASGMQIGLITPTDPNTIAVLDIDWSSMGKLAYGTWNDIPDPNNSNPPAMQVITDVNNYITLPPTNTPTPTATNTPTPTPTFTPTPTPGTPPQSDLHRWYNMFRRLYMAPEIFEYQVPIDPIVLWPILTDDLAVDYETLLTNPDPAVCTGPLPTPTPN
jgi:WD40 repeat protein